MSVANQANVRGSRVGMGIAAAVVLLGVGALGYQVFGPKDTGAAVKQRAAFYTDDDGRTFFKDEPGKIVPFKHNGKQAYRVDVFQGPDGKQFAGLMYRYTDGGRKEMESFVASGESDPNGVKRRVIEQRTMQVRKVEGGGDWQMNDVETAERLQETMRAPGGGAAKLVTP
jgi:hypothetical protein